MTNPLQTQAYDELVAAIMKAVPELKCLQCSGDSYYVDHAPAETHGPDGSCQCCPIQVQCEDCKATGIGRPITLEDVLLAIGSCGVSEYEFDDGQLWMYIDENESLHWLIGKPLSEQEPEAISFLHSLLCQK